MVQYSEQWHRQQKGALQMKFYLVGQIYRVGRELVPRETLEAHHHLSHFLIYFTIQTIFAA